MCDVEKIDMEQFIMEVKKRTCIWDLRSEEYKDKKGRDSAWREICCIFFPNFAELPREEKNSVSHKLQLKWRNMRDYYRKGRKKEAKERAGSGRTKRFRYIFADQLTFLTPLLEMSGTEASCLTDDTAQITEERSEDNSDETPASIDPAVPAQPHIECLPTRPRSPKVPKLASPKATRPTSPKVPKPACPKMKLKPKRKQSHDNCSKPTPHIEYDDDRLFFDSLLPVVRTFDIDQKLEFRSEVLRILQRVRCTKFLLQRYEYQTPAGQREYASSSHFSNIYNQGQTPSLCDEASTKFRETPQKQSRNSKAPPKQSNETEILNTESPESDLSTLSDDNNEMFSCK